MQAWQIDSALLALHNIANTLGAISVYLLVIEFVCVVFVVKVVLSRVFR